MLKRFFGGGGSTDKDEKKEKEKQRSKKSSSTRKSSTHEHEKNNDKKKLERSKTVEAPEQMNRPTADDVVGTERKSSSKSRSTGGASGSDKREKRRTKKATSGRRRGKKREIRDKKPVDLSKPLDWPATPDLMLDYHKSKPFLTKNEEWLVMELNEYECLVESLEIIKIIAKHSKFFEIDPDELWEEFFEEIEEMPTYDDIINYDVWQEFRDKKYPC